MPRRATQPRYWPGRKGYYVTYQGRQYCLASEAICLDCAKREAEGAMPTCARCKAIRHKADLRFAEIVHLQAAPGAGESLTVFAVVNRYLDFLQGARKASTFRHVKKILSPFALEFGHKRIRELSPALVEDWLARMGGPLSPQDRAQGRRKPWGPGTRRLAANWIDSALNYAVRKLGEPLNPLGRRLDRPRRTSRADNVLITDQEHAGLIRIAEGRWGICFIRSRGAFLARVGEGRRVVLRAPQDSPGARADAESIAARLRVTEGPWGAFADVLRFLYHTGARPSEVCNLTAADWQADLSAFVFGAADPGEGGYSHKTAGKGKERAIYVTDPLILARLEQLRARYPEGPLYRTRKGRPWTTELICDRFQQVARAAGARAGLTPYSYRHTSITNMLLAGHPAALVAEAHGTSVTQIALTYGHLRARKVAMRDFWAGAKSPGGSGGAAKGREGQGPGSGAFRVVG